MIFWLKILPIEATPSIIPVNVPREFNPYVCCTKLPISHSIAAIIIDVPIKLPPWIKIIV
jgi:hypothetical protein